MPGLTLADALRYFFAPFVLVFYLTIYDAELTTTLQQKLGTVGVVAFLVAGSVIYFLYRYLLYDWLILWLHDNLRTQTYRRYLGERYAFCHGKTWCPACTVRALRLYHQVQNPDAKARSETAPVRASGIHLLYQGGLIAIPFIPFSKSALQLMIFVSAALFLLLGAVLADKNYEEEELLQLKKNPDAMDRAAAMFGYAKK